MEMITRTDGGLFSVTLRGKFTFNDNPEFRGILEKIGHKDIHQTIFHMDDVDFVDSAALGMLLLAYDEAKKHSKSLLLSGVNGQVKRIFAMARFEQFFKFS